MGVARPGAVPGGTSDGGAGHAPADPGHPPTRARPRPRPHLGAPEQAILRQDPGLTVDAALAARADVSPYPGLAAYGEADTESFVGREEETNICLERLTSVRLLAIVGPSGSGKSSLLRAGVAAALRRGGSHVVVITP